MRVVKYPRGHPSERHLPRTMTYIPKDSYVSTRARAKEQEPSGQLTCCTCRTKSPLVPGLFDLSCAMHRSSTMRYITLFVPFLRLTTRGRSGMLPVAHIRGTTKNTGLWHLYFGVYCLRVSSSTTSFFAAARAVGSGRARNGLFVCSPRSPACFKEPQTRSERSLL